MSQLAPRARQLHEALQEARADHRRAEHRLAGLLAELDTARVFLELGYGSYHAYARAELYLTTRQARALLQLGRALPGLPELDAAFASGRLGWTKARELLRVVTPETCGAWVERAATLTSRELERYVHAALRGDLPPKGEPKGPERERMVFHVEASEARILRDAIAVVRAQLGGSSELTDGALLAAMAQRALQAADEQTAPTGERYRVVLEHCPTCRTTACLDHEVRDTVVAECTCDHEVVDLQPGPKQGHLSRAIPPATRRTVLHRDRMRCAVPGCECRLWLDLHHLQPFAQGGSHDASNLLSVCGLHHRLVHEGYLALERSVDGTVTATWSNGRTVRTPPDPRGSPAARQPAPTGASRPPALLASPSRAAWQRPMEVAPPATRAHAGR